MIKNLESLRIASGISQQSINKYENHPVEPDIFTLTALADYFNTTIDYLVGRSITPETQIGFKINGQEMQLIKQIRKLDDTKKICINTIVDRFIKAKK